jgi:hypothetical protein
MPALPNPPIDLAQLGSRAGQATIADLPKFATGGVTIVLGTVET